MTPPVYIHQTEKLGNLLHLLQASKAHMAVVIDEYGGTQGIVTMEDILEELVGEIWDEHDDVEEPVRLIEENTYLVDGAISLNDFCQRFDVESDSECVSLGGWVMEQLEGIPGQGDRFDYENLSITVTETGDHRVETVTVVVREPAPAPEQ